MNRLILVGNGFDLAHGLKTSYKDFIDDFWEDVIFNLNLFKSRDLLFSNDFIEISQNSFPSENISNFDKLVKDYTSLKRYLSTKKIRFDYKNNLFRILSEINANQNWVDIENIYYKELKKIEFGRIRDYTSVDELNEDFNQIKKQLEVYLSKIKKDYYPNNQICKHILNSIYLKDLESLTKNIFIEKIFSECIIENDKLINYLKDFKKEILQYKESSPQLKDHYFNKEFDKSDKEYKLIFKEIIFPKNTLLLNFNYTNTTLDYIDECNKIKGNNLYNSISEIHIHGELNNPENPIIFGFGDDVDKKYQEFEDLNDNRYLENFKSIAYLQTDSYKKLLEFIDSDEYQVFIFGHSCGISDRTMLNTIFEHDNCKSIKPFYHKKEDGTDNYTEIVQNISRSFNDKKKYRDRVVNKTYCEPLT